MQLRGFGEFDLQHSYEHENFKTRILKCYCMRPIAHLEELERDASLSAGAVYQQLLTPTKIS